MKLNLPDSLVRLIKNAGAPVYVVGGFVRNAIAGFGDTDIDLAGPLVATALTLPREARVQTVNFRLGTAVINYMGETYEYTPFRTERYSEGGAHTPTDISFTSDISIDASRRDFTANSIYYDVINDVFIDRYNGQADIERGVLRAYNPEKIFAADGLRILRLVRIAAETGFKIDGATAKVAIAHADFLSDISPERKREELNKMLVADTKYGVKFAQYRALKLMSKMGALKYVLPSLAECDGVPQNEKYHKYDVLEHTFQAVKYAPPHVRLAALFHDTGKPYCFNLYGNMHGHEKISENVVKDALGQNGLKYSNAIVNETARLCANHMYDMAGNTSLAKIKFFIAKNFDIIDKLVELIKADRLATGYEDPSAPFTHRFTTIKQEMINANTPMKLSDILIDGNILAGLGLVGAEIGDELESLWRDCILNPELNNPDWLFSHATKKAVKLHGEINPTAIEDEEDV